MNLLLEHSPEAFQPGFTPGKTSDTKFPHWFQALFSRWPSTVQLAVGIYSNAFSHSHNTHSDPFCLCSVRTSDGMTNTFTSVPTFSVNRFNYHDRTLEDKRGNDLARSSGEPRSRWPDPARSAVTASISPLFLSCVFSDKIEELINDADVPHLHHIKFSVNHLLWWWGRGHGWTLL